MLVVGLLPLALFAYKRNIIKEHLPVFLFVFNSIFFELTSTLCVYLFKNNVIVFNLYDVFQLLILFAFFKKYYGLNSIAMLMSFIIYSVVYVLTFNTKGAMQDAYTTAGLIIVALSILSLINSLLNPIRKDLKNINLITFSFLFYNLFALVLFVISNYIFKNEVDLWIIHNVIQIISILIISYSIWKLPSKSEF
jgi:hypothetical protein